MGEIVKKHKRHLNKWPLKNLKFFAEFMDQTGITPEKIEEVTGIRGTVVRRWMRLDNTNLSNICKIMDCFGYRLKLEYKDMRLESPNIQIQTRDEIYENTASGRMAFLNKMLMQKDISRTAFAAQVGASRTSVINWFKNDDIFVRWLFVISEKTGWELLIKITPKN